MQGLAIAIAAFAAANLAVGQIPIYLSLSGLVLAAIVYQSRAISPYLRIFVTMYALGYLLLAAGTLWHGELPQAAE